MNRRDILRQGVDVTLYPLPFKKGGKIHIKPENRGKFTASAKRAGHSVQQHAQAVLSDPNASATQKKRANFARNASKWNREDGGVINPKMFLGGMFAKRPGFAGTDVDVEAGFQRPKVAFGAGGRRMQGDNPPAKPAPKPGLLSQMGAKTRAMGVGMQGLPGNRPMAHLLGAGMETVGGFMNDVGNLPTYPLKDTMKATGNRISENLNSMFKSWGMVGFDAKPDSAAIKKNVTSRALGGKMVGLKSFPTMTEAIEKAYRKGQKAHGGKVGNAGFGDKTVGPVSPYGKKGMKMKAKC